MTVTKLAPVKEYTRPTITATAAEWARFYEAKNEKVQIFATVY